MKICVVLLGICVAMAAARTIKNNDMKRTLLKRLLLNELKTRVGGRGQHGGGGGHQGGQGGEVQVLLNRLGNILQIVDQILESGPLDNDIDILLRAVDLIIGGMVEEVEEYRAEAAAAAAAAAAGGTSTTTDGSTTTTDEQTTTTTPESTTTSTTPEDTTTSSTTEATTDESTTGGGKRVLDNLLRELLLEKMQGRH